MEDKLKILKMLEDGRIDAQEAARLLELVSGSKQPAAQNAGFSANDTNRSNKTSDYNTQSAKSDHVNKNQSFQKNTNGNAQDKSFDFNAFSSDLSKKFNEFSKNIEPKLQKFTETVVGKTVQITNKISKSIAENRSGEVKPRQAAPSAATGLKSDTAASGYPSREKPADSQPKGKNDSGIKGRNERKFDLPVLSDGNELAIKSFNGDLLVKGYNGDMLIINVSYNTKQPAPYLELQKSGPRYQLLFNENDFDKLIVEAFVPEKLFVNTHFSCANGNIDISMLDAEMIKINAEASKPDYTCKLNGLNADNLFIDCNNYSIKLYNSNGKNALIENGNAGVEMSAFDYGNIKLSCFNSAVHLIVDGLKNYSDYHWLLETNNQPLYAHLPAMSGIGYHIKASAAIGQVRVNLPGLSYISNDIGYKEVKSFHYETLPIKVQLNLETSNSDLTIG